MKSIKIIATRDIDGDFPYKKGDVIREIDTSKVSKFMADSKTIRFYYNNDLHEFYHSDRVRLEVER